MRRGALLAVAAVLVVAGWWRLHGLSTWSLDGDELFSHYDVRALLSGGEWPQGARSHPLGYALMAGSVAALGEGAGALRLPSALAGLASVAALLLARRDALPRAQALVAGALAALSPWLIYHSQEARFYGPLFLLATLSTLWALPGPRQRPAAALVAALLAALCHPSALLALPGLAVLLGSDAPPERRRRVLLLAGVGLAVVLALGGRALYENVRAAIERRGHADYDAPHLVAGLGYNLGLGTGACVLAALPAVWRAPRRGERALLLAAVLPPLLLVALALCGVSVQQRYALVAVPAALLLAGRGLLAWAHRPAVVLGLAAAALLVPVPELAAYAGSGDRHDFRAAADWLVAHATPDDIVVADDHSILDLYLLEQPGWERALLHEAPLDNEKFLRQFPHDRRELWVVVKRNRMQGAYGREFTDWVGRWFVPVAEIGAAPPALARHDNVLSIYRRRERPRG